MGLPRLVGTRFQALFHDPSPGCFSSFPHGTSSLSVTREYLGLPRGRGRFTRDFTGPVLLGNTPRSRASFAYGTVTRYGQPFQTVPLPTRFVTSRHPGRGDQAVPQPPHAQRPPAITRARFSLFPVRSPLLGESLLLSLPAGTEMFHFPALPPAALCIQAEATVHDDGRVSPFGHPRITARLPAPRGLSQAPTSFIGSWYQDIHRVPL